MIFSNGILLVGMAALMAGIGALFPTTREVFLLSAFFAGLIGGLVSLAVSHRVSDFRRLHTFLLTGTIWITGATAGALPLWLWQLSPSDAFFEAMSGITTTGSTVMTGLDTTAPGILLWRAVLQWLGGVGFIVTGIAFLPILRVGGMQLFRTESSERGEKEMASAARFAGATVWIYLSLTGLCALVYATGGMSPFEAVAHALTTVSTGGYSTSDASFGHFESAFLQWSGTLFMIAGSLPFAWYIKGLNRRVFRSEQVRGILIFFALTIALLTLWRVATAQTPVMETLRLVAFNVVSVVTTTGYATTDYTTWGPVAVVVFFALTAVGGCTGSTSGGAKIMRWIILFRMIRIQIGTIQSPSAIMKARYEGRPVERDVTSGVSTFFFLYFMTVGLLAVGLGLYGLDFETSVSGALTAVANVGPGVGNTIGPAGNFATLPDGAKLLLCFGMYVGRLEMLTVYVLLTAAFWREVA
ncbi:TrkH family potassium uptake protein [Jannaschia formosa]|uniref:TrkH family potassium uptake protein n=1 Tax=Jannaschia formosa TaxID=2259592 RepID=UPI0027952AC3|nr:TrkH family potassium uptake protein [Jannaschia formosa]